MLRICTIKRNIVRADFNPLALAMTGNNVVSATVVNVLPAGGTCDAAWSVDRGAVYEIVNVGFDHLRPLRIVEVANFRGQYRTRSMLNP